MYTPFRFVVLQDSKASENDRQPGIELFYDEVQQFDSADAAFEFLSAEERELRMFIENLDEQARQMAYRRARLVEKLVRVAATSERIADYL